MIPHLRVQCAQDGACARCGAWERCDIARSEECITRLDEDPGPEGECSCEWEPPDPAA